VDAAVNPRMCIKLSGFGRHRPQNADWSDAFL